MNTNQMTQSKSSITSNQKKAKPCPRPLSGWTKFVIYLFGTVPGLFMALWGLFYLIGSIVSGRIILMMVTLFVIATGVLYVYSIELIRHGYKKGLWLFNLAFLLSIIMAVINESGMALFHAILRLILVDLSVMRYICR